MDGHDFSVLIPNIVPCTIGNGESSGRVSTRLKFAKCFNVPHFLSTLLTRSASE